MFEPARILQNMNDMTLIRNNSRGIFVHSPAMYVCWEVPDFHGLKTGLNLLTRNEDHSKAGIEAVQ